jgi:hypothetical protein
LTTKAETLVSNSNVPGGGRPQPPGANRGAGGAPANGGAPGDEPLGANLRDALRTRAERIPLRALERRGFRNVQVLDMATIEKIVGEAVTHLLERHTAVLSSEDRAKLEIEARSEFSKLLAEHKKVVAEKTDAERAKERLERQLQGLGEELARQKTTLTSERERAIEASQFTLSPASFKEMEEKIRQLFGKLMTQERRLSLAEVGPKALSGLSDLEREVAEFLDRLLTGERDRFLGVLKKDQSEKVEVLEKRILKLNKALSDTEAALRHVSQLKAGDPGIASIYDSIQGLSAHDLFYEKKKEVLELIFQENLELQKQRPRKPRVDVNEAGVPIEASAAPVAAVVPAPRPARPLSAAGEALRALGFEPPLEPLSEETAF